MIFCFRVLALLLVFTLPLVPRAVEAESKPAPDKSKPEKPAVLSAPEPTHDSALLSPPPAPTARRTDPTMREMSNPAAENKNKIDPMGWLGISVKLGVASVAVGKLQNPVYNAPIAEVVKDRMFTTAMLEQYGLISKGSCSIIKKYCQTSGRTSFLLSVALHVGGDGFGWDVEPYFRAGGNALAVGIYSGPKFDIHVVDPVYIGFGFGARVGYISAEGWLHGVDIFGRIPVHVTYYVTPDFALTTEGSFGAGVSGFVDESRPIRNPITEKMIATSPKIAFGAARSWDVTIGIRFP